MAIKAVPAYHTPRNPKRKNMMREVEAVARLYGVWPLTEWQYKALAVLTEIGPDGEPWYTEGNVFVPRRAGKSVVVAMILVFIRMLFWEKHRIGKVFHHVIWQAQTVQDALRVWNQQIWPMIDASDIVRIGGLDNRKGNRSAASNSPYQKSFKTGAICSLLANVPGAGRGLEAGLIIMDEVQQFPDHTRMRALGLMMNEVAGGQIIMFGTMGGDEAVLMNQRVDGGRMLAQEQTQRALLSSGDGWEDLPERRCYIEWGLGDVKPPDIDILDEDLWVQAHPMIGERLFDLGKMREGILRDQEDRNGVLNEWLNTRTLGSADPAIPWRVYESVERDFPEEWLGEWATLGLHADRDMETVSVSVVGRTDTGDGTDRDNLASIRPAFRNKQPEGKHAQIPGGRQYADMVFEVPKHELSEWLVTYLTEHKQIRQISWLVDSEVAAALDGFGARIPPGVVMTPMQFMAFKQACSQFRLSCLSEAIWIRPSPWLRKALASVVLQPSGNGFYFKPNPELGVVGADELWSAVIALGSWKTGYGRRYQRPEPPTVPTRPERKAG